MATLEIGMRAGWRVEASEGTVRPGWGQELASGRCGGHPKQGGVTVRGSRLVTEKQHHQWHGCGEAVAGPG